MKIGIDIDEVVVEWLRGFLCFIKDRGINIVDYEEFVSYNLEETLGIDREASFDLADAFQLTEGFNNIALVDGVLKGVKRLSENFDIYFITARPKNILKKTREFIFSNFRILGDKVVFSGDLFRSQGKNKDEICKDLGINLMVEDRGEYSLCYAGKGIRVLLLDKPWNQGIDHKNIYRCFGWGEVVNKIEELNNV